MKAPAPLRVALKPSRLLAGTAVVVYGATLILVWALPLPVLPRVSAIGLIASHLVWVLWRYAWRQGARAIVGIVLRGERRAEIARRCGTHETCSIGEDSFVSAVLTVVRAYPAEASTWPWTVRTILVLPDMLDAETYRQLRVLLRMSHVAAGPVTP
jgi:hypothetical protein